jgi:hypothetical protein
LLGGQVCVVAATPCNSNPSPRVSHLLPLRERPRPLQHQHGLPGLPGSRAVLQAGGIMPWCWHAGRSMPLHAAEPCSVSSAAVVVGDAPPCCYSYPAIAGVPDILQTEPCEVQISDLPLSLRVM